MQLLLLISTYYSVFYVGNYLSTKINQISGYRKLVAALPLSCHMISPSRDLLPFGKCRLTDKYGKELQTAGFQKDNKSYLKAGIQGLISKHKSDYYCKSFKTQTHIFALVLWILSRCDSNMLNDAVQSVGRFIKITAAKVHVKRL